jgi:hypothetical protein
MLVTPEIAFEPSDVQAVCIVQPVYPSQLDGEANFVPGILTRITVYNVGKRKGFIDDYRRFIIEG